jgi:hypothetical protein
MKQRRIRIEVFTLQGTEKTVIFEKDNCSPQDIISCLSLFGDDGVRFLIAVYDLTLSPDTQQN